MTSARFGRLTDAPAGFVLVGGRVVDPSDGTDELRDVAVRDGVIVADVSADLERIDASGLIVAPGFCDLHTHLREPGTGPETIASGSRAAAHGGFTTVCAMPNTDPPLDDAGLVRAATPAGEACRVRVIGCATRGRRGVEVADLGAMASAGAVAFSDDGAAVPSGAARETMLAALRAKRPFVEHAEDARVAGDGVVRGGSTATRLGLAGWPAEAELAVVERDIDLAAETGAHLHLTHLSTAGAVRAVRDAKARGVSVTCDVTPHHFSMTDAWVGGSRSFAWGEQVPGVTPLAYDASCRVNPPLAPAEDALALLDGLADGTVDAIATDHAPHPVERKLVPFADAAPGMIGLETALSLALAAVGAGHVELSTAIAALTVRPAKIIGERRGLAIGEPADLVAFDPVARWRVVRSTLASAAVNTPLIGMELPGVVRLTVAAGRVTYRVDGPGR